MDIHVRRMAKISDMNVQATGIAAYGPSFRNSARLHFTLRIWPQCDKLSGQDAATAIRQDVLTRKQLVLRDGAYVLLPTTDVLQLTILEGIFVRLDEVW